MPVDFRYHVISLVAVFCALAIGLLVGFSMVSSPQLEEQVEGLTVKVDERIDQLTQDKHDRDKFVEAVTPSLLRDRLTGREIAIVVTRSTGDSKATTEAYEALRATIQKAGGQVNSTVLINRRFYLLGDPKYERTRGQVMEALKIERSDPQDIPKLAAARLIERIVLGDLSLQERTDLEKTRAVSFIGDYAGGADSVVLVGGLSSEDDSPLQMVDVPMIQQCLMIRQRPVRVVACEMRTAPVSAIARYKHAQVATTVDDIDTVFGRVAAVLALQGREGDFGVKETADSLLPPLETPAPGSAALRR
jgi:hypothetical protein